MRKLLAYLFFTLLCPAFLSGQEFSVKDFFPAETDLTANTPGTLVLDQNGSVCALIKVETTLDDYTFDVGSLGITKTIRQGGEIWVYVPYGVRKLTISHPVMGVIRDFAFPISIESGRTYILKLNAPYGNRVYDSSKKQRMILEVYPTHAAVEINGMSLTKNASGVYDQEYSFGIYDVIVSASRYHVARQQIEVNDPEEPHRVKISLKPQFGWLKISGSGDEKLYIDSEYRNFIPNADIELNSGTYRILLEKPLHKAFSTTIQISDSVSVALEPEFEPIYRDLEFNVADNAEIWINDVMVGKGSYRDKLAYGVYEILCKKENHTPTLTRFEVTPTTSGPVTLPAPQPILGRLIVDSNVSEAKVYIDNKPAGLTPYSAETIIGTYKVTVKKDGYAVSDHTVYINEGVDNAVYAKLDKNVSTRITSYPNASLAIDGKAIGQTPQKTNLSIGEHKLHFKADGYVDLKKTVKIGDTDEELSFYMKKKLFYDKVIDLGFTVATNFEHVDFGASLGLYSSNNIYTSIDWMLGLTKTDVYTFVGSEYGYYDDSITCAFIPSTLLFKVGYPLNLGARCQFIPVAGLGVFSLLDDITDSTLNADFDKYVKADNKLTAFQVMGGFRFNIAISDCLEINIMPAYYYRTNGTDFLRSLTAQSPYVEQYGKGFKLHIGINYYKSE